MYVAFADPNAATFLLSVGSDGEPTSIGPVPISATGLCATADHLLLAGLRMRDRKAVVMELEPNGKIVRELELPVAGTVHRHPQAVCTAANVRIVWEEEGPGKASTLAWADLSRSALGPSRRHAWSNATVGFASAPDLAGVALLRDAGHPSRATLHLITDKGPDAGVPLPVEAVGTPVTSPDGTAVLLVPTPQTLQLATIDTAHRIAASPTVLAVNAPSFIAGALLVATERGVWAIAAASSGVDTSSIETPGGDLPRREDFTLVAFDARSGTAGPALAIGPPLAAAWLDGKLVLWTGRTSAAVATWKLAR
jgi:hypothetical protein